jgi:Flp pilus assembly protein TadG
MRTLVKPQLLADRRGNVAMMFALSLPIFLLGAGLAIDYSRAAEAHTKLLAAADAAALAALTPAMMSDPNLNDAKVAAQNAFYANTANIQGLSATPVATATVTSDPNNALLRHATLVFTASVNNMFAGLIGMPTTTFGGQSDSAAEQAPNIDFYVLLDNSPSMALPQTQAGINKMMSLTPTQDGGSGCALACHMAKQDGGGGGDTEGNLYWNPANPSQTCSNGNAPGCIQMDNYQMARHYNIPLRIDNLTAGMTALLGDADAYRAELRGSPSYSFTVNTMDSQYAIGFTSLMPKTVNTYSSAWATASQGLAIMEMYGNNASCAPSGNDPCGAAGSVGDWSTNYDDALSNQLAQITTPGNGTNAPGDKPQAVLFIVTDGVEDEWLNGNRVIQAINQGGPENYCDAIKATGAKIAILYTTYLPLTTDSYYNNNVASHQNAIAPQLQACATPGLFIQAQIGQDLGQALGQLFEAATSLGHLTASN